MKHAWTPVSKIGLRDTQASTLMATCVISHDLLADPVSD